MYRWDRDIDQREEVEKNGGETHDVRAEDVFELVLFNIRGSFLVIAEKMVQAEGREKYEITDEEKIQRADLLVKRIYRDPFEEKAG